MVPVRQVALPDAAGSAGCSSRWYWFGRLLLPKVPCFALWSCFPMEPCGFPAGSCFSMMPEGLPRRISTQRLPRSGNLFRTDLRFASSLPQRFACGLLPFTRDMGFHGLCGRVPDPAGSIICHPAAAPWPGDSLIRSRCARLLAKPEYFPAE